MLHTYVNIRRVCSSHSIRVCVCCTVPLAFHLCLVVLLQPHRGNFSVYRNFLKLQTTEPHAHGCTGTHLASVPWCSQGTEFTPETYLVEGVDLNFRVPCLNPNGSSGVPLGAVGEPDGDGYVADVAGAAAMHLNSGHGGSYVPDITSTGTCTGNGTCAMVTATSVGTSVSLTRTQLPSVTSDATNKHDYQVFNDVSGMDDAIHDYQVFKDVQSTHV